MSEHHHKQHQHLHGSAHHHDQGAAAVFRYSRLIFRLWRSEVNAAVVRELALKPGEVVVDLGAGAGAATMEAARTGARVIAVDPMPFMRTLLSLRRLANGGRIEIKAGAAESLPLPDRSIDALWTVNTLHHWTDREAAARELARVLKPGARFILLDEDFHDSAHPEHDAQRSHRHKLHFEDVDPMVLAETLKHAGFAQAVGERTRFEGRPVKWVRGSR